jgi:outer membrane protein TolC
MKQPRFIIAMLFLSAGSALCSREAAAQELDVRALLKMAESGNFAVQAAGSELAAAEERYKEARSSRFPELGVNLAAGGQLNPADPVEVTAGEFGVLEPPLPPMLLPSEDSLIIAGGDYPLYRLEVKASVPLFTSGEIDAAVKRAGIGAEAEALKRRMALLEAQCSLKSALCSLSVLRELRLEAERQSILAGRLVEKGRQNMETGLILRPAFMELEAEKRKIELLFSEIERRERERMWELRRAVGRNDIRQEDLLLPGLPPLPRLVPALESLNSAALENSPELQLLRLAGEEAEEQRRGAASNRLLRPKAGLELSFSYEGTRLPFLEEGWDDAGRSRWNLTALAGIELPLLDGGGRKAAEEGARQKAEAQTARLLEGTAGILAAVDGLHSRALYLERELDYLRERMSADNAAIAQLEREVSVGAADEEELIMRRLEASGTAAEGLSVRGELCLLLFRLESITGTLILPLS